MKEYIKGNKRLRINYIGEDRVRIDFFNDYIHTYYIKPVTDYNNFVNYLLDVWLKIYKGLHYD